MTVTTSPVQERSGSREQAQPTAPASSSATLRPGPPGAGARDAETPRPGPAEPPQPLDRRALRRRLVTLTVLVLCGVSLLLAVPALRPVVSEIIAAKPALVAVAIALELASCLSFVVIFRLFFEPVPAAAARELAWSQMGSGALLPGGGVGALAVGGWLLHLVGMPVRQIVQRSSGLFFLTSGVNVLTLAAAGFLLLIGVADGPHDVLRTGLPVIVGLGAAALVLGLSPVLLRIAHRHPRLGWLADIGSGVPDARQALTRPTWRLAGALGYLLFDIAVLWTTLAAVGAPAPAAPIVLAYLFGYLANAIPTRPASGSSTPAWSAHWRSTECRSRRPAPRSSSTTRSPSGSRHWEARSATAGYGPA